MRSVWVLCADALHGHVWLVSFAANVLHITWHSKVKVLISDSVGSVFFQTLWENWTCPDMTLLWCCGWLVCCTLSILHLVPWLTAVATGLCLLAPAWSQTHWPSFRPYGVCPTYCITDTTQSNVRIGKALSYEPLQYEINNKSSLSYVHGWVWMPSLVHIQIWVYLFIYLL